MLESYNASTTYGTGTIYVINNGVLTQETDYGKNYENAGHDADRIFCATRAGQIMQYFIIRGYTDR